MNLKLNAAAPAALLALHDLAVARNMDFIYDDASSGSRESPAALILLIPGAIIGYYAERAWHKYWLDKDGANYSSDYLGGKKGAIIGAIALPLLVGLLR